MKNPISAICDELGVTLGELAILVDVDASRLRQIKRGEAKRLGSRLIRALSRYGYDPCALEQAYAEWKRAKQQEVIRQCRQ